MDGQAHGQSDGQPQSLAPERFGLPTAPWVDAPPVYSIVVPVYNEELILPLLYQRVAEVMDRLDGAAELVLVNDGSRDNSYRLMRELAERDPRVRVVDLSRNFGHQLAISAGMEYARGRAVIIMDADLQDPPEVIPELIAKWRAGADVVYAQRISRAGETRFKLLTARLFYRLIRRLTAVDIPADTGDFRLLDRRVVDTLVRLREHHRFMRGLSAWVGYRQAAVPYERAERAAGQTKYPLRKMLRFAADAITGFSYVPLQLATTFGFLLAGLSLVGIVAAIAVRLFTHQIVGQASTLILVLFLGGIQLIFLGIIGEYLGRIYDEVRQRPLYIVREVLERSAGQPMGADGDRRARPRDRTENVQADKAQASATTPTSEHEPSADARQGEMGAAKAIEERRSPV